MSYTKAVNDIQTSLLQLRSAGWTLAAIADEVGVTRRTADRWYVGDLYPQAAKAVLFMLTRLAKRKRIPKKRRKAKGSPRHEAPMGGADGDERGAQASGRSENRPVSVRMVR